MATHSSIPDWKIPWMEEPGEQQFTASQRVGHNRVTSLHFLSMLSQKAGLSYFLWLNNVHIYITQLCTYILYMRIHYRHIHRIYV